MKIGLFIPCYVDVVYPQVGVATYRLLKHLGLDVEYPLNQTCCGQPMANAGFEKQAIPLAEKFEDKFKDFDYVVAPSVSCTAFIKINYPRLLKGKHECMTSGKIMDVVEFLHDVIKVDHPLGTFPPQGQPAQLMPRCERVGIEFSQRGARDALQQDQGSAESGRGYSSTGAGTSRRVLRFRRHVLRGRDSHQCADGTGQGTAAHEDRCTVRDRPRLFLSDAYGRRCQEARPECGV